MNNHHASRAVPAVLAVGLMALAGAGLNLLPVPLGYGLDLLPGLFLAYLALFLFGRLAGALVVLVSVVPTFWLWGNPYAGIIIVAELLFVAALCAGRWRLNPLLVIAVFWASAGWLSWLILSQTVMQLDPVSASLIVIKQASNGMLAAAIAMLLLLLPVERWTASGGAFVGGLNSLQSVLLAIFTVFTLLPFLASIYLSGQGYRDDIRETTAETLAHSLRMVEAELDAAVAYEIRQMLASAAVSGRDAVATDLEHGHGGATRSGPILPLGIYRGGDPLKAPASPALRALLEDMPEPPDTPRVRFFPEDAGESARLLLGLFVPAETRDGERVIAYRVYSSRWLVERLGHLPLGPHVSIGIVKGGSRTRWIHGEWHEPEAVPDGVLNQSTENDELILQLSRQVPGPSAMHEWAFGTAWSASEAAGIDDLRLLAALALNPLVAEYRDRLLSRFAGLSMVALMALAAGFAISAGVTRSLSRTMDTIRRMGEDLTVPRRVLSRLREPDALNEALCDLSTRLSQERQRVERSTQRLQHMVNAAPVVLWSGEMDQDRKIRATFISRSIQRLAGVDEVQDFSAWFELVDSADRMTAMQLYKDLLETGYAAGELRIRRSDGECVWIYSETTMMPARDDQLREVVGIWVDISQIKQNQRNVVHASKMASIGELVTGVAHELNQPIQVIQLAADNASMLLEEPVEPGDAGHIQERLARIASQATRAGNIVDKMRIFGRNDNEKPSDFALVEVVDSVLAMLATQIRSRGIEIRREDDGLARGHGHKQGLEQVLINLLINARDAVEQRRGECERWIRIATRVSEGNFQAGPQCELVVEDSGGGIDEEIAERIFEPFFTTKPAGQGTGLGLSISYGLMRGMGGMLTIRNAEQGAVLTARLPLASDVETS